MKNSFLVLILMLSFLSCDKKESSNTTKSNTKKNKIVMLDVGIESNQMSSEWQNALVGRMKKSKIDSLAKVVRPMTKEETAWKNLIKSKIKTWNSFRDSIKVPFKNIQLNDTIVILLGYNGKDDAFTYQHQTICLDLTALYNSYGSAEDKVNDNRIDRFFAHEFTHLLHKEWAVKNDLKLNTFKDRILWECTYEGFGMYRSMSSKWFPVGDSLSKTAKNTFKNLYPIFTDKIIKVATKENLTNEEKINLHSNLSKGSMKKKWGALPVAVWLALEAKGDDKNLIKWVDKGPDAIIELAEKYLINEDKIAFDAFLKGYKKTN